MRPFRFSLAALMGIVLCCGIAVASLRYASDLWGSALFTLAVVMLLASIVGLALARGRTRATWLGSSVFGWGYLAFSFGPWFGTGITPPPMLTTKLFEYLHSQVERAAGPLAPGTVLVSVNTPTTINLPYALTQLDGTIAGNVNWVPNSQPNTIWQVLTSTAPAPAAPGPAGPSLEQVQRVGHSLMVLLSAVMGAIIARCLHTRYHL